MTGEVLVRYMTVGGKERTARFREDSDVISLDLREIESIDLLPLIWCNNLEYLNIRDNKLSSIDLTPLSRCKKLKGVRLKNNQLADIDLSPLEDCPDLEELDIRGNQIKWLDVSPLFHCPKLQEIHRDRSVTFIADLALKSVGSWPEVLVEQFHRIIWKAPAELE